MNTNEPTNHDASSSGAITFSVTALVFLALGCLMLAGRPGFLLGDSLTGHGQAWVNLMLYGFGLPAVFGAVYWALPRAFGVPLYSNQLVFLHYGFHMAAFLIVMILPFVPEMPQASMGATFLACGAVVFVVNVAMTLRRMPRPDAGSAFISTLTVWLVVAMFLGLPFGDNPPLPILGGTMWSAGWLVLVIGGVFFNALLGLALRVTPLVTGGALTRTAPSWYALAILNLGLAWTAAAVTFGPLPFVVVCAGVFLVGALIYLLDFWVLLQRRPTPELGWDVRILLTSVWMIPTTAVALIYAAWEHLQIPVPEPIDPAAAAALEETVGPMPLMVMPMDWMTGIMALLATAAPGLVAVIFQLQKLEPGRVRAGAEPTLRERVPGQILLVSFFNYAVGASLVVVGAWAAESQMLGLGAVFLVVGALGFLGMFLHRLGQTEPEVEVGANAAQI